MNACSLCLIIVHPIATLPNTNIHDSWPTDDPRKQGNLSLSPPFSGVWAVSFIKCQSPLVGLFIESFPEFFLIKVASWCFFPFPKLYPSWIFYHFVYVFLPPQKLWHARLRHPTEATTSEVPVVGTGSTGTSQTSWPRRALYCLNGHVSRPWET